jgi:proline dehydrogenase
MLIPYSAIKERSFMDEKISALKDTIKDLISNITKRISDISNEYDATGNADSERLVNLFDDLQALAEGIDIVKDNYSGLDLMEFQEKIDVMEKALEIHDMMLLFDVLRYELKDLLIYWTECLS